MKSSMQNVETYVLARVKKTATVEFKYPLFLAHHKVTAFGEREEKKKKKMEISGKVKVCELEIRNYPSKYSNID